MNEIDKLKSEINEKIFELQKLIHKNEDVILPHNQLYEFHQGGEVIFIGTMGEIQKFTTLAPGTLTGFSQPAYLKKNSGKPVKKIIKIEGRSV